MRPYFADKVPSRAAALDRALTRAAEELFLREIAESVAEHSAYLEQYGSLAEAVRALDATK